MTNILATELGTIRKKWTGRLPVALIYPNTYPVAVSSLGFQLVYGLINDLDELVCERFVLPDSPAPLRSLESNRPLRDFPLVLASVSFEHDYVHLISLLAAGHCPLTSSERPAAVGPGAPLVILGGVALLMNPEPLAPFADLMVIGEAEPVLAHLLQTIATLLDQRISRQEILETLARTIPGCYVPSLYHFSYGPHGEITELKTASDLPPRIAKNLVEHPTVAAHSRLFSPEAELDLFMTELGRGCSRGCRFCAAGFIYRPPRLWRPKAVIKALQQRPAAVDRVGLLGMETAEGPVIAKIIDYLRDNTCALSFSSLRADRISPPLIELLTASKVKSVAIAPDGCSERLRRVINKNLDEDTLLQAAISLTRAGIVQLKLYVMIGLPTETEEDLAELADFIIRLKGEIDPLGRARGRLTEITLSINSFVPKPWTPFQYCSYGGLTPEEAKANRTSLPAVRRLKSRIKYLRKRLGGLPNVRLKPDRPDRVLRQAVLARGDRRLAPALINTALRGTVFKKALHEAGLSAWEYAVRARSPKETFPWEIVDHSLKPDYLEKEYRRAFAEKSTKACQTQKCKSCGVCAPKS